MVWKKDQARHCACYKSDTWCPTPEQRRLKTQWVAGREKGPFRVLTGTEGPGTGVDCVTVVTARVSGQETVVVMALELVMFTLSPWVLSTSPWSLAAGGGSAGGKQRAMRQALGWQEPRASTWLCHQGTWSPGGPTHPCKLSPI